LNPKEKRQARYKLAILTSHPIQYYAPLYKKLASHPRIDLMAYYCSDHGVTVKLDPGFGIPFKWDTPLLEGYPYKFLRNISPRPGVTTFWGLINPGIIKEIFKGDYDGIVVQGYMLATNWIAYLAAWVMGTPVLFRGETEGFLPRPWWLRMIKWPILKILFAGTRAFLTIGSASASLYSDYGVPKERLFLTPYSIDNDYFMEKRECHQPKKDSIKEELGIFREKVVILFSGKLIERKRPLDLLKAFEKVEEREKAALIFIGDGEQNSMLGDYCRERNIEDVYFLGFKNQSELGRLYAVADLLVLPSIFETWGLVINELMCYGVAIVATNMVGSSFDIVSHGGNGFIYPAGDVTALTEILSKLISNERLRTMMGKKSLEIISMWNYDACVEGILNALVYITRKQKTKR